jgi:uncharacterized protein (DUF2236 family)
MLAAELCLVPRALIPPTFVGLRAWLAEFETRGELQVTDGARKVLDLFLDPPAEAEWRPILRGVSRLAYGTLPAGVREMYGLPFGPLKRGGIRATFPAIRVLRPLLPPKYRFIAPYQDFLLRQRGIDPGDRTRKARARAGIRL